VLVAKTIAAAVVIARIELDTRMMNTSAGGTPVVGSGSGPILKVFNTKSRDAGLRAGKAC
jgi:hypothetical protein